MSSPTADRAGEIDIGSISISISESCSPSSFTGVTTPSGKTTPTSVRPFFLLALLKCGLRLFFRLRPGGGRLGGVLSIEELPWA